CIGCAACFRYCPPQIIRMSDNRAEIEQSRCIRCYCCLELCSYSAISLFPR
ncbi:MAG: 4Fe-4S dicluster domain-containing protein, partial [Dethiobacter sp.]|nr:4Fe-4S dicluster domain-containing protein [Dethiobacter sp.]